MFSVRLCFCLLCYFCSFARVKQLLPLQDMSGFVKFALKNLSPSLKKIGVCLRGERLCSRFAMCITTTKCWWATRPSYREVEKPAGTKRVKVGVRDLGNGYFEDIYETQTVYKTVRESYQEPVYKSVPVYATKYRYEIYRWKPDKVYRTSGRDTSPKWSDAVPPITNTHREAERYEKYVLHFKDERGNEFSDECSFERWQKV
jgi:hypothetical protein